MHSHRQQRVSHESFPSRQGSNIVVAAQEEATQDVNSKNPQATFGIDGHDGQHTFIPWYIISGESQ